MARRPSSSVRLSVNFCANRFFSQTIGRIATKLAHDGLRVSMSPGCAQGQGQGQGSRDTRIFLDSWNELLRHWRSGIQFSSHIIEILSQPSTMLAISFWLQSFNSFDFTCCYLSYFLFTCSVYLLCKMFMTLFKWFYVADVPLANYWLILQNGATKEWLRFATLPQGPLFPTL